jgi:hypothetical protein
MKATNSCFRTESYFDKIRLNNFAQRARLGLENLCRYENDKRSLTSAELRTLIGIACVLDCPLVDVYREILGMLV